MEVGDFILLFTDGLTDNLDIKQLVTIIHQHINKAEEAAAEAAKTTTGASTGPAAGASASLPSGHTANIPSASSASSASPSHGSADSSLPPPPHSHSHGHGPSPSCLSSLQLQDLCHALTSHAEVISRSQHANTPFSQAYNAWQAQAQAQAGRRRGGGMNHRVPPMRMYRGGKEDDITVVLAQVQVQAVTFAGDPSADKED